MELSASRNAKLLIESKLFDVSYYIKKNGLASTDAIEVAEHYMQNFRECPDTSIFFSGEDYIRFNPDIGKAGINPLLHYLQFGMQEARRVISDETCIALFRNVDASRTASLTDVIPTRARVRVLYTTAGNFFFQDIADYAAKTLERLGWNACAMADTDPREREKGWFDLVMAPHEYMTIGAGALWEQSRWKNAAYFNTEQWQTPWFAACFKYLHGSRQGVIDLNPTSAAALQAMGIRAAFLPLLPLEQTAFQQRRATISRAFARRKYIESLDYPEDIGERQYDLLFVANLNERRQQVLAGLAPALAPFKAFLHAPIMSTPVKMGDGDMLSGRDFTQLALNSKILLNIHRDNIGYFEWHRLFLYGIANGTVVLTEPSFRPPLLELGVHYLEASVEAMPALIRILLSTSAGLERLRAVNTACRALCARLTLESLVPTP